MEPVAPTKVRSPSARRAGKPLSSILPLIQSPIQRRLVRVRATDAAEVIGIGDLAILERRSIARRTLSRLVEDLVARGAAGLVIHQELADCLSAEEREALEDRLPLLVVGSDWERVSEALLTPTVVTPSSHPEAALRSILRGEAPPGAMPAGLDTGRPLRALAVIAHPDERAPLPLSKLEEVVATEALLGDPRARTVTVDGVVVALTGNYVKGNEIEGLGRAVLHRAQSALLLSSATVGIGRSYSGAEGLRRAFREALWAATVAEALWGGNRVVTFRQLGIFGMLEPFVQDPSTADTEDVEQLLAYDKTNHTALLPTLEAYFEAGRSGDAAAVLFVHRNTISYRLRAVQRITGLDVIGDADARLLLEAQMKLARLRGLLPPAGAERPTRKRKAAAKQS